MKKGSNIKLVFLIVYLVILIAIYFRLVYSIISKPKDLAPTKIPSLSITELKNANILFEKSGKQWSGLPSEPDISTYTFGQRDPM